MDLNFGHMVIKKDGEKCSCGNYGCFERYASMKVLKEKIKIKMNLNECTGKELFVIMQKNYEEVKDIIEEFISDLIVGVCNIINIFEPEAICIGGSFAYYKELLLDKLIEKMQINNITFNNRIPKIVIAKFGNDAGIIGACIK